MAILSTGSKVLVSGANGYVATWVVRRLLENGYFVRGTVRSQEKGVHLNTLFKEFRDKGKFELVVVPDITKEGAFDEAVKGVDAIEHTASPFHFKVDDPEELIGPAVSGTTGIIKSALKLGPSSTIRRIVVTSSAAAVFSILPEPKVFDEKDWNDQSVEEVKAGGKASSAAAKYRASKVLAERAAWDIYNENKSSIPWDLVVLNPPFILGPFIHEIPSPSSLGTSLGDFYNTVVKPDMGGKSLAAVASGLGGWIDVRDVADAHVRALEKVEAGGERLIVCAGPLCFQDFIDCANSLSPSPIPSHTDLPKGNPGAGKALVHKITYDTRKSGRVLGLRYRTMEELTRDTLADFERRGW